MAPKREAKPKAAKPKAAGKKGKAAAAKPKKQPAEAKPKEQPAEAKPKEQPAEAKEQPAEAKEQPAEAKPKEQPAEAKEQPAEAKEKEKEQAPEEKKPEAPKKPSEQPRDEVGTRKGFERYRWELKDSNKEIWSNGHAQLKLLSMFCLMVAYLEFKKVILHPVVMDGIVMEVSLFSFFVVVYTLALNRYITCVMWSISDLLNNSFAIVFLVGILILAVEEGKPMPETYLASVVLVALAIFLTAVDMGVLLKHFKRMRKKNNILVPPKRSDAKGKK